MLQWVRGQNRPCPWDASTCAAAAQNGHLDMLKWLRGQDPPCPWDSSTCAAAENGHLNVLQWLRCQDPPCLWNARTCAAAARNGHLYILQWLRSQDPPCPWDQNACTFAAQNGHFNVLQWLRCQDPRCPWDQGITPLYEASKKGHLKVFELIITQVIEELMEEQMEDHNVLFPCCNFEQLCFAYINGHLNIIQYDHQHNPNFWVTIADKLYYSIRGGHLHVLKWLDNLDNAHAIPWSSQSYTDAVIHGQFDILKWLRGRNNPCAWNDNGSTCEAAAADNNLEVLQWLRSEDPPCPWNENTCMEFSSYGNIKALEWARSQNPPCPWNEETYKASLWSINICKEDARCSEKKRNWLKRKENQCSESVNCRQQKMQKWLLSQNASLFLAAGTSEAHNDD